MQSTIRFMLSVSVVVALVLWGGLSSASPAERVFLPGQVWKYMTRPNENMSLIIICKVETLNGVQIVHVVIDGLKMKQQGMPAGEIDRIGHLPFTETAMQNSVTQLVETSNVPDDYLIGYRQWRALYNQRKATAISVNVRDALRHIENSINGVEGQ